MTRTAKNLSLVLIAALLAAVGFTVIAGGPAGHRVASFFGHGGHHGCGHPLLSGLIKELDLSEEQQGRLKAMHGVAGSHREVFQEAHIALHGTLVQAIEGGELDEAELNRIVDSSLEEVRRIAYSMTGEMSALVSSLDDGQRAILTEHIEAFQAAAESGEGHGFGHSNGHGHGHSNGHGHSD